MEKVEAVVVESPGRQKEDELHEVQREMTAVKEQHEEEIGKLKVSMVPRSESIVVCFPNTMSTELSYSESLGLRLEI